MAEQPADPLQNTEDAPDVVVVGVDTSTGANRVVSMAARLSRALPEATLHVVHVFRVSRLDRAPAGGTNPSADALHDAKDHLEFHVRAARAQCRNPVVGHFVTGDPTGELLRICLELGAKMLVVGTHDYVGFERLLLGSVAENLVRKAGCSVLVVRPAKPR